MLTQLISSIAVALGQAPLPPVDATAQPAIQVSPVAAAIQAAAQASGAGVPRVDMCDPPLQRREVCQGIVPMHQHVRGIKRHLQAAGVEARKVRLDLLGGVEADFECEVRTDAIAEGAESEQRPSRYICCHGVFLHS